MTRPSSRIINSKLLTSRSTPLSREIRLGACQSGARSFIRGLTTRVLSEAILECTICRSATTIPTTGDGSFHWAIRVRHNIPGWWMIFRIPCHFEVGVIQTQELRRFFDDPSITRLQRRIAIASKFYSGSQPGMMTEIIFSKTMKSQPLTNLMLLGWVGIHGSRMSETEQEPRITHPLAGPAIVVIGMDGSLT